VRDRPRSRLAAVTVAPETGAPFGSSTRPETVAVVTASWAEAQAGNNNKTQTMRCLISHLRGSAAATPSPRTDYAIAMG
jgi:hypothetical protein